MNTAAERFPCLFAFCLNVYVLLIKWNVRNYVNFCEIFSLTFFAYKRSRPCRAAPNGKESGVNGGNAQSDLFQQLILAEGIFVKNQIIRPDAQCTGKIHKDGEAELCIGGNMADLGAGFDETWCKI